MRPQDILSVLFIIFVLMVTCEASAHMASMGDEDLSSITGQSGVSISIDEGLARVSYDTYYIGDTDHERFEMYDSWLVTDPDQNNRIEFNNLVVDDGAGGFFSFATPAGQPITFDVGTNPNIAGQTLISMALPQNTYPRTINVGNFVFLRQDIGSIIISSITETERHLLFGPHATGSCGIDFYYADKIDIGQVSYTYNSILGLSLTLNDIHLSQTAQGSPEVPSDWAFTGPFRIGSFSDNNPGTLDVGTSIEEGVTVLHLNAPMQGSFRVGNVSFGDNSFGPCALDGINVHRMSIELVPGS